MKHALLLVIGLLISSFSFAQNNQVIVIESDDSIQECLAKPDSQAFYTSKVNAGWLLFGLETAVEEIKFVHSDVKIEELWEKNLIGRSVRLKITGNCAKVIDAAIAFESIHIN